MSEHVGYVKLYRSMLDWEWYDDPNTVRVFLHILLKANWKESRWRGETLNPGDHITTLPELSSELNISMKNVRTALEHLKAADRVTVRTTTKYRVISVNNWNEYQQDGRQNGSQAADKGQTNGRQAADNVSLYTEEEKEGKNIKKREGVKAASPSLREVKDYILSKGYRISPERFFGYYESTGWRRGSTPITDWKSLADVWEQSEWDKPAVSDKRSCSDGDDLGVGVKSSSRSSFDVDELEGLGLLGDDWELG